MENKREQTRSIEIDKPVMVGFFKSLPCALTHCILQWRFDASVQDHF